MLKKRLTIIVIIHPLLEPPDIAPKKSLADAPWRTEYYVISNLKKMGHTVIPLKIENDLNVIELALHKHKADLIFNLLEEFNGEALFDHNVVAYLELLNIPYTGCNSKGLLLAKDKALSKKILHYNNILTPNFAVSIHNKKFIKPAHMKFPLIVKSKTDEGSFGISQNSVVKNDEKLQKRIQFIHHHTNSDAIIEEFIEGKDIYVSIMGKSKLVVLPPLELSFNNGKGGLQMATSNTKWNCSYQKKHGVKLIPPQNFSDELIKKITTISKKIYKELELTGYARLDLRVSNTSQIYFLEANPNPDIADTDEFATSAKLAGISYPSLLTKIVSNLKAS